MAVRLASTLIMLLIKGNLDSEELPGRSPAESENTLTCENCKRFACNSRMSLCFLTRTTCKKCDTNHIPRASLTDLAAMISDDMVTRAGKVQLTRVSKLL